MTSEERHEARFQRRKQKRENKRNQAREFEKTFSYRNLYRSYQKCCRGVGWKASVINYRSQAPLMVYRTRKQLLSGNYKVREYQEFDIFERGVQRHIRAVKFYDRVVQNCVCVRSMVPLMAPTFIYDNCASVPGKGYHFALNRMEKHLRRHYREHGSEGYVLLMDFSHFFNSIDHAVSKAVLEKAYGKNNPTLQILYDCIDSFGENGMGLGSPISQIMALAVPNALDHYIKEDLHVKKYLRYMDDSYIIHRSKKVLKNILEKIKQFCSKLHLVINEKKTRIVKLTHGFIFLKARVFLTSSGKVLRKIYKRSVTKERQKLKKLRRMLDDGIIGYQQVHDQFQSWLGYAKHFDSWYAIQNMKKLYNELYGEEKYFFIATHKKIKPWVFDEYLAEVA